MSTEPEDAVEHLPAFGAQVFDGRVVVLHLWVYSLFSSRSVDIYLVVCPSQPLSRLDSHLTGGLLQSHRNFCGLVLDAQTDELTGLAHRKTFESTISKIYELATRPEDTPVDDRRDNSADVYWLAMVDMDCFKLVNDRFGHLYGDEVLILIAQILKTAFLEDDLVYGFGGEEFVLLVRCPDRLAAARRWNVCANWSRSASFHGSER